jgi:hypothetical protein
VHFLVSGKLAVGKQRVGRRDDMVTQAARSAGPEGSERSMALGIATLAWLVSAGMLAMFDRAPPGGELAEELHRSIALSHLLVPLLAGVLCQSSVSRLPSGSRIRHALGLWAGWTLLGIAAVFIPPYLGLRSTWSGFTLLLQQGGLVIGVVLGSVVTPRLARWLDDALRVFEIVTIDLIAVLGVAIIFVPLAAQTPLLSPASGWQVTSGIGYLKALPAQLYLLLKSVILWLPLGLLFALARKHVQLKRWAMAGALGFVIVGLPLLYDVLKVQDLVEIVSAYWGIGLGLWVGGEVHRSMPEEQPHSVSRPAAPPATDQARSKSERPLLRPPVQ